jgi:hypothetical protein
MLSKSPRFGANSAFFKKSKGRRMFSAEEDNRLKALVAQFEDPDWKFIAAQMANRTPRQCRERFKNYLSPDLSSRPWSETEDDLLHEKVSQIGQRWAQISPFFLGRSDVSLKNRWTAIGEGRTQSTARNGPKIDGVASPPLPVLDTPAPPPEKSEIGVFSFINMDPVWKKEEQMLMQGGEGAGASVQALSAFRNYGGRIW